MLIYKTLARAGTYRLPDGTTVDLTPDMLLNAVEAFEVFRQHGREVPVHDEHNFDAVSRVGKVVGMETLDGGKTINGTIEVLPTLDDNTKQKYAACDVSCEFPHKVIRDNNSFIRPVLRVAFTSDPVLGGLGTGTQICLSHTRPKHKRYTRQWGVLLSNNEDAMPDNATQELQQATGDSKLLSMLIETLGVDVSDNTSEDDLIEEISAKLAALITIAQEQSGEGEGEGEGESPDEYADDEYADEEYADEEYADEEYADEEYADESPEEYADTQEDYEFSANVRKRTLNGLRQAGKLTLTELNTAKDIYLSSNVSDPEFVRYAQTIAARPSSAIAPMTRQDTGIQLQAQAQSAWDQTIQRLAR